MAKHTICSIYDSATEAYMRPFIAQSKGQAVRMFTDLVKDPQTDIAKHPEDYSLFEIGNFNDNTAEVTNNTPQCIVRAHEITTNQYNETQKLKEVN